MGRGFDDMSWLDSGRTAKVYAKHGNEPCPHGAGRKAYCGFCMSEADEQYAADELEAEVKSLKKRVTALEALLEDGGPGREGRE